MPATRQLYDLGQSLWLDNITRDLLTSGTLRRYINEFSVTGLTSNPTIFERAMNNSDSYDRAIANSRSADELLLTELMLEDLTQAADLFRPIYRATSEQDGWVSLEVSPLLADDAAATIKAAIDLYSRAERPNLLIKIPATAAGLAAIEEVIFAGVPVNITLLFSRDHYAAAADAYAGGIERRIAAGLDPRVGSVASLFVSRWDAAVNSDVPQALRNHLGIAVAEQTYQAYREFLDSARWRRLAELGACPQRLLWASTGTKDPNVAETLYVEALAAPLTINTLPEKSLLAFAQYGEVTTCLSPESGNTEATLAAFARMNIDVASLAESLQREGARSFSRSWCALLECVALKRGELFRAHSSVG